VLTVPINGSLAEWFNAATSATVTATSFSINGEGHPYSPQRLVDRQARTGGDSVIWVANEGAGSAATLTWGIPIEIREAVLYGIPHEKSSGTNIRVQDSEILLYYKSKEVGRIGSTGEVLPAGTHIPLPETPVDALTVVVTKFFGTVRHRSVAGLAEIETIARIH
jgi:hypothetical protein